MLLVAGLIHFISCISVLCEYVDDVLGLLYAAWPSCSSAWDWNISF